MKKTIIVIIIGAVLVLLLSSCNMSLTPAADGTNSHPPSDPMVTTPTLEPELSYHDDQEIVAQIIHDHMNDIKGDDPTLGYYGEHTIDGIAEAGGFVFAVVRHIPNWGHHFIYLFVIERVSMELNIFDVLQVEMPISMGVAVYRFASPGVTAVFGAVTDQIWLNLDDAPLKVDFSEVQVIYSQGHQEEHSVDVANDHAFLVCIDGDVYVNDILFLSNNVIIGRYSDLPIGDDAIDRFNENNTCSGEPVTY